jgi:F0F1-type ATP synthase assembly protein I
MVDWSRQEKEKGHFDWIDMAAIFIGGLVLGLIIGLVV